MNAKEEREIDQSPDLAFARYDLSWVRNVMGVKNHLSLGKRPSVNGFVKRIRNVQDLILSGCGQCVPVALNNTKNEAFIEKKAKWLKTAVDLPWVRPEAIPT